MLSVVCGKVVFVGKLLLIGSNVLCVNEIFFFFDGEIIMG